MQLALQIRQLYTHAPTLLTWVPLGILGQFPIDLLMAFRDSPTMIIEVPHTVYWSERGWAKGIWCVYIQVSLVIPRIVAGSFCSYRDYGRIPGDNSCAGKWMIT
jgi:hypothetical protein